MVCLSEDENHPQKKSLRYVERDCSSRISYLRTLRSIVKNHGGKSLVYVDESGFEEHTYRPYAWSLRGEKSYGERFGSRGTRTNLIAGKQGKKILAPFLYEGSTTAVWFNKWLKEYLVPELPKNATVIMDNARFHKKKEIADILDQEAHQVLFLPPYSPDFNPIEQDFAILKKMRMHAPPETTLDSLIKSYGYFLE